MGFCEKLFYNAAPHPQKQQARHTAATVAAAGAAAASVAAGATVS